MLNILTIWISSIKIFKLVIGLYFVDAIYDNFDYTHHKQQILFMLKQLGAVDVIHKVVPHTKPNADRIEMVMTMTGYKDHEQ